jgi:hypothetical protein
MLKCIGHVQLLEEFAACTLQHSYICKLTSFSAFNYFFNFHCSQFHNVGSNEQTYIRILKSFLVIMILDIRVMSLKCHINDDGNEFLDVMLHVCDASFAILYWICHVTSCFILVKLELFMMQTRWKALK